MPHQMPDIASNSSAQTEGSINWVGMSAIEMPVMLESKDEIPQRVGAKVEAFVDLVPPSAKGIHMSRLFLRLDDMSTQESLSPSTLNEMLTDFISSHEGISDKAQLTFSFDYHLRRSSLLSQKTGWKAYPTTIKATREFDKTIIDLMVDVPYSSTCPCSAALARQLIQQAFIEKFSEQSLNEKEIVDWLGSTQGIVATPHSQRSIAQVKIRLVSTCTEFPIKPLIDLVEHVLQTPVQTAVKREDEQEFARLNASNLMFCEDAVRRVAHGLSNEEFPDYWIRINHYESLHAHDAVAIAVKGITDGFTA